MAPAAAVAAVGFCAAAFGLSRARRGVHDGPPRSTIIEAVAPPATVHSHAALAYVENGTCRLVSRYGNVFRRFQPLAEVIAGSVRAAAAILDGEVVCLDEEGKPRFDRLLFRREPPCYAAFDLVWLNGRDLRQQPLLRRKQLLRRLLPRRGPVLYVDHCNDGAGLFHAACQADLEGVVAKLGDGEYRSERERTTWIKVKNPTYSQAEGRHELFESRKAAAT